MKLQHGTAALEHGLSRALQAESFDRSFGANDSGLLSVDPPFADAISNQWTPRLCCAFQELGWSDYDLIHYPQVAFSLWVAKYRSRSDAIPTIERLTCPLAQCREQFDNTADVATHISSCPFLKHGEYWCNNHGVSEYFTGSIEVTSRRVIARHSPLQRLSVAIKAIGKLGSMSIRKAVLPSKRKSHGTFDSELSNYSMDQTDSAAQELQGSAIRSTPSEIDGHETVFLGTNRNGHRIYELTGAYMPSEMADTFPSTVELGCNPTPRLPSQPETTEYYTSDPSTDPVSPVSSTRSQSKRSCDELHSPVSPVDHTIPSHWSTGFSFSASNGSPTEARSIKPFRETRNIVSGTEDSSLSNNTPNTILYDGPNLGRVDSLVPGVSDPEDTITSADTLRRVVSVVVHDSQRKLGRASQPFQTILNLSTACVLQSGLSALKSVLLNELPETLADILGLAHLAYAAAVMFNPVDHTGDFDTLYRDIVTWSQAISDLAEQVTYRNIVPILWSPISSTAEDSLPTLSVTKLIPGRLTPVPTMKRSTNLNREAPEAQTSFAEDALFSKAGILQSLKNGWAVRVCLHYLASLEYARMVHEESISIPKQQEIIYVPQVWVYQREERNNKIRVMITQPIIQDPVFKDFLETTLQAEELLFSTRQVTLRKLEIMLVHNGKDCAKSRIHYEAFINRVAQLCDAASPNIDRKDAGRQEHFIRDIDWLFNHYKVTWNRAAADTGKEKQIPHAAPPAAYDSFGAPPSIPTPSVATPASTATTLSRDPSASSFGASSLLYESPNTVPDPSEAGCSPPSSFSPPAPPSPDRPPTIPSPSPSPGGPPEASLVCDICGTALRGQRRWLASNLKRHKRERHGEERTWFSCPHDGCPMTTLRRSNLEAHMKVHAGAAAPRSLREAGV